MLQRYDVQHATSKSQTSDESPTHHGIVQSSSAFQCLALFVAVCSILCIFEQFEGFADALHCGSDLVDELRKVFWIPFVMKQRPEYIGSPTQSLSISLSEHPL